MAFLHELHAFTAELEALTERVRQAHEARGVPEGGLIVTTEDDTEMVQLAADFDSYRARYDAFMDGEIARRGLNKK